MQTTSASINGSNDSTTTTSKLLRRRFTPVERQAILKRYHAGNLRQPEFVAREGISKASLGKWLHAQRYAAKAKLEKPRFQEVLLKAPRSEWQVEIVSPQNWTVRFAVPPPAVVADQLLRSLPC